MRQVVEALIALSPSPNGFTASDVAVRVRALSKQSPCQYGPRHVLTGLEAASPASPAAVQRDIAAAGEMPAPPFRAPARPPAAR